MKRQTTGVIGSILLIVGVFMPVMSVPFIGGVDYFRDGTGDGVFVLGLGVVSLILVMAKRYKWLVATSSLTICMLMFTLIQFHRNMARIKEQYEAQTEGNPFAGLGQLALDSIQLQWGWAPLFLGAIMVAICAGLKDERVEGIKYKESAP